MKKLPRPKFPVGTWVRINPDHPRVTANKDGWLYQTIHHPRGQGRRPFPVAGPESLTYITPKVAKERKVGGETIESGWWYAWEGTDSNRRWPESMLLRVRRPRFPRRDPYGRF